MCFVVVVVAAVSVVVVVVVVGIVAAAAAAAIDFCVLESQMGQQMITNIFPRRLFGTKSDFWII